MNKDIKKINIPSYIVDLDVIDKNINKLKKGMDLLPHYNLCYSTKTNPLKQIIMFMNSKNIYSECVSVQEYDYLLKIGISGENIVFNGPIKTKETLLKAINNNSYINLDSLTEVQYLVDKKNEIKNYNRLGLRLNINLGYDKMNDRIGYESSRFGFSEKEFSQAIKILNKNNINVTGLHYHINSNYDIEDTYKYIAKNLKMMIKKYNLQISNINFGGGILRSVENSDFCKYANTIIDEFKKHNLDINKYTLFFEPGAAIVASSAQLYSKIMAEKTIDGVKYLTVDISKNYFDITNKFNGWKHFEIERKLKTRKVLETQIICGFSCMEGDRILNLKNEKELKVGDKIIFNKVGAYSVVLSPCFINGFPEIYYIQNNKVIDYVERIEIKNFWY